jgi:6-pyruvoyltetrahydropterin/6-carboxytetrahydropterin synthase
MKFELKQQFQVESARFLPNLPKDHPCSRLHGHSFKIILTMVGEQDPHLGWVRDYHEIEKLMKPILTLLDHHNLNEIPGLENPTSESLSYWIYEKLKATLPELKKVSIQETSTTECSYPA